MAGAALVAAGGLLLQTPLKQLGLFDVNWPAAVQLHRRSSGTQGAGSCAGATSSGRGRPGIVSQLGPMRALWQLAVEGSSVSCTTPRGALASSASAIGPRAAAAAVSTRTNSSWGSSRCSIAVTRTISMCCTGKVPVGGKRRSGWCLIYQLYSNAVTRVLRSRWHVSWPLDAAKAHRWAGAACCCAAAAGSAAGQVHSKQPGMSSSSISSSGLPLGMRVTARPLCQAACSSGSSFAVRHVEHCQVSCAIVVHQF